MFFAVLRVNKSNTVLALHNVTGEAVSVELSDDVANSINHSESITLEAYEVSLDNDLASLVC